ncbi:MAG: DNA (cytosine-5-)-methyltransferase [Planctomycetaceae bacterium]|nr:DNA (cytosine-5-)-methyltransferase [Planctomycetaceae bacterium]
MLHLDVTGLAEPILTDLPVDAKTGKARGIFRKRSWVRQFFESNGLRAGDKVVIERKEKYHYLIRPSKLSAPVRVAEFFAGIGLVRLGLENCGFKVAFANDIDPQKLEMYRANFPADDFLLGDIHQVQADQIPDCDVYTASFPCNDLSIAGAMAGLSGAQSSAFWGLIRLLSQKSAGARLPRIVLLENVPGFLMSRDGKDFEAAVAALNQLGYVCDAMIIDAVRFVPQSRARLFVVAQLDVEPAFPFGVDASDARPSQLMRFIHNSPHLSWKIRPLPKLPAPSALLPSIIEDLPESDPAWWSKDRTEYFMNQLSDRHAATAAEMIHGDEFRYATAFRRVRNGRSMAELRTDGVAGCLRTPKGGSGRQILFKAGKGRRWVRLLTARECARLQGVSDSYRVDVPLNQALFGFGDAVCVPVIEWIAVNYLLPALRVAAQ